MVKKIWLFIALTLLVILPTFAQAQDNNWQVLVYSGENILRVTEDGLADPIELPEQAQDFVKGQTVFNVALSPDERYFLFVDDTGVNYNARLNIADLTTEDCCTIIPAPEGENWEVINMLGWSPDGREIVLNFLKAYTGEFDSLLAILNVETGEYRTSFDPTETNIMSNAIFFIGWNEDGIELKQSCFPCGASADGPTLLWNPETDEISSEYYSYTASAWGDRLGNGDIIQSVQNPDYPITQADSMFDPANIVQYFHADDPENTEIIYFDADNLHLINPQWVIDGEAYVIQDAMAERVTVVWRDGHEQVVEFEMQQVFLTGTPDGWLMMDTSGGRLFQYRWNGDEIEATDLGGYPVLRLLSAPELGTSITDPIVPILDNDV